MKWNRYLHGSRVILRRVETSDLPLLAEWRNTPEIWRRFFNPLPIRHSTQRAWLEAVRADERRLFLVIVDRATRDPVGAIGLDGIDPLNQSAELGNVLIAAPERRGRGLAREAAELMIDLAFHKLNLRRLYLYVFEDNVPAVRLYRALGFRREGRLRGAVFHEGRFKNLLLMAVLRDER